MADESRGALAVPRPDVETMPSFGMEDIDFDYDKALVIAQKRGNFVKAVRMAALGQTFAQDWLARKAKDGSVTFDLMGPGAERIHAFAPIGFMNRMRTVETWTKEDGTGYTIRYEADVYLGPKTHPLPVIGTCSSDDDFFSTEHIKLEYNAENPEHAAALESAEGNLSHDKKMLFIRRRIPSSEVTRENIDKSALTNLVVNGVTRIMGLRKMGAEQLKIAGVDVEKIATVDYGSTRAQSGKLSPAEEQKRDDLKRMLVEMSGGDEAKALAELKRRTAFNDYTGCDGWDKLSSKQLGWKHGEVAKDYAKWKGEAPAQPAAKPKGGQAQERL
jgi:hypothetical protein